MPGTNQRVDTLGYYYHADEEVYIIYGDEDNYYDDSYETSFDGSFRFENLRKGTYTVFIYSDCESDTTGLAVINQSNPVYAQQLASTIWKSDCVDGEVAVKMDIEITENDIIELFKDKYSIEMVDLYSSIKIDLKQSITYYLLSSPFHSTKWMKSS